MASNWLDLMKSLSSEDKKPRHSPTSSMTKFTRLTIVTTRESKRKPWALKVEMDPAHPNKITVMPLKQFWKENNDNVLYHLIKISVKSYFVVCYTPFERTTNIDKVLTVLTRKLVYTFTMIVFLRRDIFDFI